jgi:hypothetical protein
MMVDQHAHKFEVSILGAPIIHDMVMYLLLASN